jgi:DNA-binding transcriptional LysR family regulator
VRFTAPADSGAALVTPALARFAERHPRVHVECMFTQRRVDLVAEGVDLALRAGVVDDASLVGRRLGSSERGVYASPVYLAAHGRPRRVSELAHHACVLFGGARGRARWQLHGPRGEEQVEVHGPLTVNEVGVMHQLTLLGTGIGLLPITFARRDAQAGRLVRLFPRLSASGGAVYLVHPASSHLPRRVAALRDHLYGELRPYFSGED